MLPFLAVLFFLSQAPLWAADLDDLSFPAGLHANREFRLALLEYRRLLHLHPADEMTPALLFGAARCHLELGEWERGERLLRDLLDGFPEAEESVPGALLLADTPLFQGDFPRARERYRRLQERTGNPEQLAWRIVWSYIEEGDFPEAERRLAELPGPETDGLRQELVKSEHQPKTSPGIAGTLSAVLPGAGQLYTGHPRAAGMSLLVNGALLAATLEAFDHDLPVLGSLLLVLELGCYGGNIYNAVNFAHRNNQILLENRRRGWRNRFGVGYDVDNRTAWLQLQGRF